MTVEYMLPLCDTVNLLATALWLACAGVCLSGQYESYHL